MDSKFVDQFSLDLVHQYLVETNKFDSQNATREWARFVLSLDKKAFLLTDHLISEITGYPTHTLLREGWKFLFSIIHPEDYFEIIKQHLWQYSGEVNKFENPVYKVKIRIKHIQGHWIVLEVKYIWDKANNGQASSRLRGVVRRISDPHPLTTHRENNTNAQAAPKLNISKREREVLDLIGKGYTTKQIACELYISTHTVTSHRKNLIDKFKVKNTAELIKEATKVHLLQ